MSTDEKRIGQNAARLRDGMTQAEVGAAMRAAGFRWSQATVSSVESGERALRLSEAQALARVLGVGVHDLGDTGGSRAMDAYEQVRRTAGTVVRAVQVHASAIDHLLALLDDDSLDIDPTLTADLRRKVAEREAIADAATPAALTATARDLLPRRA